MNYCNELLSDFDTCYIFGFLEQITLKNDADYGCGSAGLSLLGSLGQIFSGSPFKMRKILIFFGKFLTFSGTL